MWPFDDDSNQAALAQPTADTTGLGGMYSPSALFDNKDFRRHAGYEALTNAGLALIAASAPSSTPQTAASAFGALAGGAAQGVNNSADRYLKNLQLGAQMQNMRMRQQMLSAPLPAPQDTTDQPQVPQQAGGTVAPAAAPTAGGPPNSLGITDNNIGNVEAPKGSPTRFQQYPDFNSGVAATIKNAQAYPAAFNGGKPMDLTQIADHWTEDNKKAWAVNVSLHSGLPLNQPLDLSNPDTAAAFARGVHGAEKGAKAVQPPEAYAPGVQLAQSGRPMPMPQGGDQQPTGNQPGVMPAPQQGIQLPPMPKPIPYSPMAQRYIASGDKGLEALGKANNAQVDTLNSRAMERWKQNAELLRHNQTTALERQKMEQTERNAKVTQAGPNNELATAETNIESAKERGKEEERTRFVYGSSDWANKTPEELRKQANPEAITLVDAIQNGQALSNIATRAGGSGGMDINKNDLIALGTKMYGKSFDTNFGEQKKEFAINMAPGKDGGKQLASISNGTQHLVDGAEAYNALMNGQYPLKNRIFNAAKTASGWGPEKGYQAIMKPVATEMARVISGSSDNSVTEREALDEITAAWNSPEQMQSIWNKYAGLAQKRLNTKYAEAKVYGYDKEYIDKRLGEYGAEALAKIPSSIKQIAPPSQGGAPATVSAIPLVASPDEAVKLGSGKTFRIMKDGKEMIGTVP